MDDIDKVIKKYGHQSLISEIVRRQQASSFLRSTKKRGAPKTFLDDLWGLQDVYDHYESLFPNEKQEYTADRVIKFINEYRSWQTRPDIYGRELEENKKMYDKVKWMCKFSAKGKMRKLIKSKTIVNHMKRLRNETLRFAGRAIADSFTLAISTLDLMENEVFVDDPRDYL